MALQYTDEMTGEEYNELRLSVEWPPITEGQAERGLAHTTFLVAARDGSGSSAWAGCCLISDIRRIWGRDRPSGVSGAGNRQTDRAEADREDHGCGVCGGKDHVHSGSSAGKRTLL